MILQISFGALVPKIIDQLVKNGVKAKAQSNASHWQKDADSIVRLAIRGLLSENEVQKARKRLLRAILNGVEPCDQTK